jgi:hypothetical protein
MADYLKRVCRFFALMALVPLFAGFIGPWSETLGAMVLIFCIPVALIVQLVGTAIWLSRGAKLPMEGRRRERVIVLGMATLLLLVSLLALLPLFVAGNFLGGFTRLTVNRDHYEAIIAQARKDPENAMLKEDRGVEYSTEAGPPVRVLFNPDGARGFAGAIVYDPTGDMIAAKGWDDDPKQVTMLFTGGRLACRHLIGQYYTCWFDW